MKRIDKYKTTLETTFSQATNADKQTVVFQELMNLLGTYEEKKELHDHFETLRQRVPVGV